MSAFTVFRDPDIARPGTAGSSKTPLHRSKGLGAHKDTGTGLKTGTPAGKTVAATPRRALGDVSNNSNVLKNAKTPGFASARKPSKLAVRSDSTAKIASKFLGLKLQSTNKSTGLSMQPRQQHLKEPQQPLQQAKGTTRQQQHKMEAQPWWDRPVERMPMNDDDMNLETPLQDTLAKAFHDEHEDDGDLDLNLDEFASEPLPFCSSSGALDVFNDLQDTGQASLVGVPASLDDDDIDL